MLDAVRDWLHSALLKHQSNIIEFCICGCAIAIFLQLPPEVSTVCFDLHILCNASRLQKFIVKIVCLTFKRLSQLEVTTEPYRQEFLQRWKGLKSDLRPLRCTSPRHKRKSELRNSFRHTRAFEGDNCSFVRRNAFRLVYGQRPRKPQGQPASA